MNTTTNAQGFVYVMWAKGANRIKIGHSFSPKDRLRAIQTGCPFPVEILATWPGSQELERRIHRYLSQFRQVGEWFEVPPFTVGYELWRLIQGFASEPIKARRKKCQTVFNKRHWKVSRAHKGWAIRRFSGYSIAETEYGVSYLKVLSRKPDRTSADNSAFPLAGYFNWKSLVTAGLAVKVNIANVVK